MKKSLKKTTNMIVSFFVVLLFLSLFINILGSSKDIFSSFDDESELIPDDSPSTDDNSDIIISLSDEFIIF